LENSRSTDGIAHDGLFRALFESAPVGIALVDREDHIVEANQALGEMLGCTADELRGRELTDFDPGFRDDPVLFRELTEHVRDSYSVERRYRRKDGGVTWGRTTVWVIPANGMHEGRYAIGIVEDITRQKRAEQELRDQETLAEIGKMAAVVAHQVKNPLAGIGGALQIIRDRFSTDADERGIIEEIQLRLRELDQTVDAVVRYARAGEPHFARLAISQIVRSSARKLTELEFPGIRVEVSGGDDVKLNGDAVMLDTLFSHLLRNAAEEMEGRGQVTVSISASDHDCVVSVSDRGPGCPVEDREHIFAPFFTTKARASGLGLALARRVARAHGGEVACETERYAGGATFVVRLPLEPTRT